MLFSFCYILHVNYYMYTVQKIINSFNFTYGPHIFLRILKPHRFIAVGMLQVRAHLLF